MVQHKSLLLLFIFFSLVLFIGCVPGFINKPTATPLPPTLTPTPVPRTLTICLGQEPDSLYPYGTVSPASKIILNALFNGPLVKEGGQYATTILERVPRVESGDITFEPTDVRNGDEVVNADGVLVSLAAGVAVFPHGCTSSECVLVWDGNSPLQLDKLKINFKLKTGLKWSDGQPLTSADSVYSFQMASDPATPTLKTEVDLTNSYKPIDQQTVQWVGKPGLITTSLDKYFWLPLPHHLWNKYTPGQLLTAEEVAKRPVGWGPYLIQSWTPGQSIRLVKNRNYYRAAENLPKFDFLEVVFLKNEEDPLAAIKTGRCDFVDKSAANLDLLPTVVESQASKQVQAIIQPGPDWELLAFGIKPVSYDDGYYPYGTDRPAFFDDLRTRQAIAACIDQQGLIKDYLAGQADVPLSSLPATDSLIPTGQSIIPYDPIKAGQLLTDAGWLDYDKNPLTPRISINVKNVPNGFFLSLNLLTADSGIHRQMAERMAASLAQCGIQVKLLPTSLEELYKQAPDGLLFGRKFDLALLSIQSDEQTSCLLFDSGEIPTQFNYWMGKTSGGANFTGYTNTALDAACQTARRAGLDSSAHTANQQKVNQIITQDLPVVPLYFQPDVFLFHPDFCKDTQGTAMEKLMAELDTWDFGSACQ